MVRLGTAARVQITRIATPPASELGRDVEHKVKDFFREARIPLCALLVPGNTLPQLLPCVMTRWTKHARFCHFTLGAALLQVCRTLPWALSKYKLDELTTVRELQKAIEKRFRDNWFVRDPRVRCFARGPSAGILLCCRGAWL